ncbi:MAG: tRNA (adenosine(37)-N6)-dimethylallyltransferase MiaA, partial [Actinomycetota bacterium]|nr:tRNA (adenosine(37)-N6)-dimethylallyltransferase MiaA [Actinomycetota bacterium]
AMSSPGLPLALIAGPTASGKSGLALTLAERTGGVVINADSAQVYRDLPILTNQSTYPTELLAIWELDHEGSVGEYQRLAHAAVDRALAHGRTPVVVGGTGLYLRSALVELDLPPAAPPDARTRWEEEYDRRGAHVAHERLAELDPAAAARVHPNDRRRVVRALELAEFGSSLAPRAARLWTEDMRHPTLVFGLDVPKDVLDARIATRTREMFEAGVEDEVRAAVARPVSRTASTIHGLREIAELPRDQAIAALNARTKRYAAYQRKWMRRIPGLVTVRADRPPVEVADEILEMARARQRLPAGPAG